MVDAALMIGLIVIWLSFGIGFVAGGLFMVGVKGSPTHESNNRRI